MRLLALLCALAGMAAGCGEASPVRLRVTVIGVDGATWRVIDPLLARGELPHLARLIAEGVRAPLRSQMPLISPPVWTTIATGVSRDRHGIREFSTGSRLIASSDRKVPALWNYASEGGLETAVVGWWGTYPAERIHGVVVSERALKLREGDYARLFHGRLAEPSLTSLVHPAELIPALADLLFGQPTAGDVAARMRAEDAAVVRSMVRMRRDRTPFDLEMLLLRGVDPVSHHFWRFYEPGAPVYADEAPLTAAERATHDGEVERHYRYVDGLLAELDAKPEADHVYLVLSDHGFEAGKREFDGEPLSGMHRTPAALHGILIAAGGPVRGGVQLAEASILDVAPTALHLLGLPLPESLEGRVLAEALDPAWMRAHEVRRQRAPAFSPAVASPAVPDEIEDRLQEELRALGYIE